MTFGAMASRRAFGGFAAAIVVSASFALGASPTSGRPACPMAPARYGPGGLLRGDIDGDGIVDQVAIVWRREATACRWQIVIEGLRRTYVAPLAQRDASSDWPTVSEPALRWLVQIDARKGREVVVAVDAGASTTAYGIFAIHGSALVRLRIRGSEFVDAFAIGGAGDDFLSFGCVAPGEIAQSGYEQRGERFVGVRHFYRLGGTIFHFAGEKTFNRSYAQLRRLPEFSATPFARCSR